MVTITQVQNGITQFVDNEMIKNVKGIQSWGVGALLGIAISKTPEIFNEIKEMPMVKILGIINESGEIDIDLLATELKKQAGKTGAVPFNVPMIGAFSVKDTDITKLVEYIKNS